MLIYANVNKNENTNKHWTYVSIIKVENITQIFYHFPVLDSRFPEQECEMKMASKPLHRQFVLTCGTQCKFGCKTISHNVFGNLL